MPPAQRREPAAPAPSQAPSADRASEVGPEAVRARSWTGRIATRLTGRGLLHALTLAIVLGVALGLRLIGLDWDAGQHLHPDERFLSIVLTQLRPAASLVEYFDPAASPLNPFNHGISFFVYGTFPLFLVEGLARLAGAESYDQAYLIGRALSAVFDTGTVLVVYLLGRRLLGPGAALLAAALLALAVHSIQLAHFFAVDTFATFFTTAALLLLVRYAQGRDPRDLGLLGIATGLAMASKLSAILLLVLVALWWLGTGWRERRFHSGAGAAARWVSHLFAFGIFGAIVFRLFQPYAFAGAAPFDWRPSPDFLAALGQQKAIQEGAFDWPPGVQWAGTAPYLFPLEQIVRWGLGPALGLLALAGVVTAVIVIWRRGAHPLVLPLAWAALVFASFGVLVLKTMRYFHPAYPVLALTAAWLLAELWRRKHRLAPLPPHIGAGLVGAAATAVVLATGLWALAFVQIYARDHSRAAASEWIYQNIDPGAVIAIEHWDDALPLNLSDRARDQYEYLELAVFDREDTRKRSALMSALRNADVLVLASNRGWGSIPRMPQRYPLAGRFYAALFGGELGFERAAEFRSLPSLGPWRIDDAAAEEAFTVYDHPQVLVFRRNGDNTDAVQTAFARIDERAAVPVLPRVATARSFELTPERAAQVRQSFSWPAVFETRPIGGAFAAVLWFVATLLATLALWPLIWRAAGRLPDAGYAIARVLGPALLVLPAWWLASLGWLDFDVPALGVSLGLVAVLGGLVLARSGRRFIAALRAKWRPILGVELLWLGAFVGYLALRARNPDVWHPVFGGEKPMDFAHLNAVIRSATFPPFDPWYAGSQLNYYYFGHVPTAALAKTLGVVPSVAYNLALAGYAAGAVAAVYALGYGVWSLFRRGGAPAHAVGFTSVLFVLIAGNLHSGLQLVRIAQRHVADPTSVGGVLAQIPLTVFGGDLQRDYDLWAPTRVIPGTVNEFPWFTFSYGDLHPHLMNFGFTVVALLGALAILALGERDRRTRLLDVRAWVGLLVLQALVLGLHRVTNPWDFPTYTAITLMVLTYALWRSRRLAARALVAWTLAGAVALAVVGQVAFLPFHQTYVDFFGGLALTPETTPVYQWLLIFGVPLAVLLTLIATVLTPSGTGRSPPGARARRGWLSGRVTALPPLAAATLVVISLVAWQQPWSTRVILVGLVLLVALAAWRARNDPLLLLPIAFFGAGLLLTAIPEVATVRDDIGRLNTVFKTYLQAWLLLGVGAALAIPILGPRLWRRTGGRLRPLRVAWVGAVSLLAATALVYPLAATPHKLALRIQDLPPTLDGEAFLAGGAIVDDGKPVELTSDLAAFRWLRTNLTGSPTILEAPTTIYRWGGRVSVYTGLPSVIGWDWHAKQQHWGYVHAVEARWDDARELFATPDPRRARVLLTRYGVDLIYVGEFERTLYSPDQLGKFEQMSDLGVTPIYQQGPVVIYAVERADPLGSALPVG